MTVKILIPGVHSKSKESLELGAEKIFTRFSSGSRHILYNLRTKLVSRKPAESHKDEDT